VTLHSAVLCVLPAYCWLLWLCEHVRLPGCLKLDVVVFYVFWFTLSFASAYVVFVCIHWFFACVFIFSLCMKDSVCLIFILQVTAIYLRVFMRLASQCLCCCVAMEVLFTSPICYSFFDSTALQLLLLSASSSVFCLLLWSATFLLFSFFYRSCPRFRGKG